MSILESPAPHMLRVGVAAIQDALKYHANILGADLPPDFFKLLTDTLPVHDEDYKMTLSDEKVMQIAHKLTDEAKKNCGHKGYYAPNVVSTLLNGVLEATKQEQSESVYTNTRSRKTHTNSERAVDEVIALAARNYTRGAYVRPDIKSLNRGVTI